jgi:hypothetical protein
MVARAADTLRTAGVQESIGIVFADGGHWTRPYHERVAARPSALLVPHAERALHRRRQQIGEPVKSVRRSNRFLRRGLTACHAERQQIAAPQPDQALAFPPPSGGNGDPATLDP